MIKRLLSWFKPQEMQDYSLAPRVPSPTVALSIYKAASELVGRYEINEPFQSGEWKRHQVYAKLIKQFPEESRNEIALALEIAVWTAKHGG